jgi:hypothetical protein
MKKVTALAASLALLNSAHGAFHFYDIQEIFSNADGSIQFVELFTADSGQEFLSGHTLKLEQITPVSTLSTFNFTNGPAPTNNRTLLIGTASLIALGVTPDFIIPAGFLSTSGANKRVNFAEGTDVVNLANLPFNGVQSLNGLINDTNPASSSLNTQASPRNHAGQTITIPEPASASLLIVSASLLFGRRQRPQSRPQFAPDIPRDSGERHAA